MCILKCFEEVSELRVNYNKSKLYGVGVNEEEVRDMARWMKCGTGDFPFLYLGLPIGQDIRRVGAWNSVVEKFKNRLSEWKAKSMSFGGRLTLVKDRWRWALHESGEFTVKELTKMVEEKILNVDTGVDATIWNKWVPEKVNIFVWRTLKRRLPVREELDKRGIDLDSLLCPSCGDMAKVSDGFQDDASISYYLCCCLLYGMGFHLWLSYNRTGTTCKIWGSDIKDDYKDIHYKDRKRGGSRETSDCEKPGARNKDRNRSRIPIADNVAANCSPAVGLTLDSIASAFSLYGTVKGVYPADESGCQVIGYPT
ncbi:transposon TX1 [Tanacetum coccineum]